MTSTTTLDDYLAEFDRLRTTLPNDPGPSFSRHFEPTIRAAHAGGESAADLLVKLQGDADCWKAEGHCAAWDNSYYPGPNDDLNAHFTAWMCARRGNIQDNGTALLDFGVDTINDNIHGPGCYRAAAIAELEDIILNLGAEHSSPDLGDLIAFVPSELIAELTTWAARILDNEGWSITATGDLADEDDEDFDNGDDPHIPFMRLAAAHS
jgi:hypothetical protein